MKRLGFGGFGAAVMAMAVGLVAASSQALPGQTDGLGLTGLPQRHKGKGQQNRRGKGSVNRAKKHPNMNHVSKRVRRKHRRAA